MESFKGITPTLPSPLCIDRSQGGGLGWGEEFTGVNFSAYYLKWFFLCRNLVRTDFSSIFCNNGVNLSNYSK